MSSLFIRALAILLLLAALPAGAKEKLSPEEAKRVAKAHSDLGRAYYDAKRYDDAIAEYRMAYEMFPVPLLLFNMGQAHRLKGDKANAVDAYKRFVRAVPQGSATDEARGHIEALEEALADERSKPRAEPVPVTPVEKPVVLEKPAPVTKVEPTATAAPVEVRAQPAPRPRSRRWIWGVVAGGAVVVGVALGVGLGIGLASNERKPTDVFTVDLPRE